MAARITTIFSGVSGQYFVAAELSRRSYVATVTLRNTRGIDIMAANGDGTKAIGIQVKTNQGVKKQWMLNSKAETLHGPGMFYVFVNLNDMASPEFHIVEADAVARAIQVSHRNWLQTPGRGGRERKDTTMRLFSDEEERYLGRWDSLGLD